MEKRCDDSDDDNDSARDNVESVRDNWSKRGFNPSHAVRLVEPSGLTWDDYIAEPKVKGQLQQVCSRLAANGSSKFQQALEKVKQITRVSKARRKNKAHRVVLMHGLSGCGKTQAILVMASEMAKQKIDVYMVDLTAIKSTWFRQTEHQLKQVLSHLETLNNVIVFID